MRYCISIFVWLNYGGIDSTAEQNQRNHLSAIAAAMIAVGFHTIVQFDIRTSFSILRTWNMSTTTNSTIANHPKE